MATAKKTTRKSTTKKDLEAKIADLEAKLNKLAAAQDAKPAEAAPKPAEPEPKPEPKEAPKPAETKKPEGGGGPHAHDEKPKAEAPPKPAEKAPPASGELHERFREIPTGNWNTQKVAITGFTAPSNRYFGSRALVAEVEVTPSNWNDQKTKVPGYTAPGNKYFATRQRLAYHPEAKKFGTWINDAPAPKAEKPAETAPEPKPAETAPEPKPEGGGGPHAHDEKPAETKTDDSQAAKEANAQKEKEEYIARMKAKGATLPKGFIEGAKAAGAH